ncbi:MAG: hypothetical protein IJ612_05035 [Prevotella sp.]|nr:hypothetical protein [Prevotella sp.]
MKIRALSCWLVLLLLAFAGTAHSQNTYEGRYTRPLSDVAQEVCQRFHVKLRFDMDTTGLLLPYADFRIRPWSVEATLTNICRYYDWNWWPRKGNTYRISRYEYYRRHEDEGREMLSHLSTLYNNKEEWEERRQALIGEVRQRLCIDRFLDSCVSNPRVILGKKRRHQGYTTQNICMELTPGQHLFGTIYSPDGAYGAQKTHKPQKPQHPLIICPDGHWPSRYRDDEQQRLGTLARMGAVCVDFDLYGYGQSKTEVGEHAVARAHVFQAACGLKLLDYMLAHRLDIDTTRIAVCGGSGGGTHTVLLALLAEAHGRRPLPTLRQTPFPRIAAIAPVVHVASHFDGGCPCESGMPVQLSCGGTCEAELAATFAPRPLLLVSDGGDWTSTTPTLELPFIRRTYAFYGAEEQVSNVHLPDERHDFGPSKRQAVYQFFARIFGLDLSRADERLVTIQSEADLRSKLP